MIGQTLSHYRILEKIGEGGMGVVYLAEDTQLGRRVAIKLLPEEFAGQQERLQRFLSEARLASSINHPNIVSIYELGEGDGRRFIAMEYVPGRSLRATLQARGLGLKKLLELALPAAEALARAHRAGVIHRDIKPENLLVSEDGYIKVADFGLAKLKPTHSGESTLTEQISTDAGKVVGTVAYMSPEQLEGHTVDVRSDIFSFGTVLYEMATGRSPFLRDSAASTTAAILRDAPQPLRAVAGGLPTELERLINKALEKEVEFRYQSMEELATDLKRLRRELDAGRLTTPAETVPAGGVTRWRKSWLWAAGAVVLAVVGVLAGLLWRTGQESAAPTPTRVVQLTTLPGLEDSPTWSPDDRSLAYVSDATGNLDIYVQQIGGGQAIRVTDSEADDAQPAWSPDGTRIAFVSARAYPEKRLSALLKAGTWQAFFAGRNGDVWIMPAYGGTARRVAEDAYYPAWSPDGKKIVYQAMRGGRWGLWIQDVDTASEPRALELGGLGAEVIINPAWSPDGQWITFSAGVGSRFRIYVVSSRGGDPRALTAEDSAALMPSWSPDGRWLFFSSDRGGQLNLWKARFEGDHLGTPIQVTAGSGADLRARLGPGGERVAYSSVRDSLDLWEYDFGSGRAVRLTTETTLEDNPRPSPDGKWLAFASNRLGGNHLWLLNRENGSLTQVTTTPDPTIQAYSHWSWDGKYLFYASAGAIWRYEVSTGSARKIYEGSVGDGQICVSADDKYLVVSDEGPPQRLVRVELALGKASPLPPPPAGDAFDAACSPDGQWVAFHVQQGNDRDVWVVPLMGGTPRPVTPGDSEDSHPAWSSDSRSIYFVRNHQDIYVVPRTGGAPRAVTNYRSFSITLDYPVLTRDRKKLLFTRNDKAGDIYILENPGE